MDVKPTRKLLVLVTAIFLTVLLSNVARSQDVAGPDHLAVDVMPVMELPANISNPLVLRSENGYLLKCQISNNSEARILGFTYQLLVLDSDNKLRMTASRTTNMKLAAYATRDLTLPLSGKLKIKSGDRVLLAVERIIGRELSWEVLNLTAALEAYGKGESLTPEVKQILNQVDSRPAPRVLY